MVDERLNPKSARPERRGPTISLTTQWHRIAFVAVVVVAAVLNFYGLDREGYANSYYAAAVRSMMENWHAFFFNSLDPTGFVSLDKPPLGFWLQVVSVKNFGYSGVALMLPQALAGTLSVALLYRLVAKPFGEAAGLIAALALALTPISVVANRNNIVDSTLVLAVLLGAWAVVRAVQTGRLRWLLLGAAFVGLGFNIKMLEAYLVVPALGLMYLVGAHIGWRRRLVHLAAAGAVLLVISLSWVTVVDGTPASQRPWVGSTATNSALDLAIGYNGLQRLTGNSGPGGRNRPAAVSGGTTSPVGFGPGGNGGPGGVGENGPVGPLRLFDTQLGPQVSWLLPIAILGFFVALWQTRRGRWPLDLRQSSLAMWGTWLLTGAIFFSIAGFYHTYYLVMIAPAISALAAIGTVSLWTWYRQPSGRLWWMLPLTLGVGAAVQVYLLADFPQWARWLDPLIIAGCALAALALIAVRLLPRLSTGLALPAAVTGALILMTAPATWSVTSVQAADSGITPRAGPAGTTGVGAFGRAGARIGRSIGSFAPPSGQARGQGQSFAPPNGVGGPPPGANFGPPPGNGSAPGLGASGPPPGFGPPGGLRGARGGPRGEGFNAALLTYLERHQGKATYLFASPSAGTAEAYIIATGKPVMAMGGFTGSDPILTPAKVAAMVKAGTIRYFLLGGFGGPGGGNSGVISWVTAHCTVVPASKYASSTATTRSGNVLYDCGAAK